MDNPIDSHTLQVLEFPKIISLLSDLAASDLGKGACRQIVPHTDVPRVQEALTRVSEMKYFIKVRGQLPLHNLKDISRFLHRAEPEGAFLMPRELLTIHTHLLASRLVRDLLNDERSINCSALRSTAQQITILPHVSDALTKSIDSDGQIQDSASSELARIRSSIHRLRNEIQSFLDKILHHPGHDHFFQEKIVTMRNNRYVIPLRADFRNRIPGLVHDRSQNQATLFVEPLELVERNNRLHLLREQETAEEIKILQNLTTLIRHKTSILLKNQKCLGILDAIQAKASLSDLLEAREPELVDGPLIHLVNARHPLLTYQALSQSQQVHAQSVDSAPVIPVDLFLPPDCSVLLITGANMGGKTAALKTFGLLTLMAQAGLHIPVAEGSRLSVWEKIFADIGDEQNLEKNVSTFSSHVAQVNYILKHADSKSLLLIDEMGAGTDPESGAALALAVIETLKATKARLVATSHLNLLKVYAATRNDVMNASVELADRTFRPTYKLSYGIPGSSRAFETAARLGIDPEIIALAQSYLKEHDQRTLDLVKVLENKLRTIHSIKSDYEALLSSASHYEKVLAGLAKKVEDRRDAIHATMEKTARSLFREAETKLKQIVQSSSPSGGNPLADARQAITTLKSSLSASLGSSKERTIPDIPLNKGDYLTFGPGGKKGKIIFIDHTANKVEIEMDGMRLKASLDDLTRIRGIGPASDQKPPLPPAGHRLFPAFPADTPALLSQVNIVGLTVVEAMPLIEKAIDTALLYGKKEIRIIHGIGTGRLLEAVHSYLNQFQGIKKYYAADPRDGGAGTTIVEFET